jgi:(2S)-methylsuccinyl-CoA dehydrogenase
MAVPTPDLAAAARAVEVAKSVVDGAASALKGKLDESQVVAYDLAHAAAGIENASAVLDYGAKGDVEARMACAFVADAIFDLTTRVLGREEAWAMSQGALDETVPFMRSYRDPEFLASLAGEQGPRHLDSDFEMVQDTFRRFAN